MNAVGSQKQTVLQLREAALCAVLLGLPAPPPEHPNVAGAVIDIEADDEGFATLVAMGEGSTSLYTSAETILGSGRPEVARATEALLRELEWRVPFYGEIETTEFPPPGAVRFHVLTPAGRRYDDVPSDLFWGRVPGQQPAHVTATQRVIAELRRR